MPNSDTAQLIIASSESDPNMLYATRFFAADAFVFLGIRGKKIAILSDLEYNRARSEAAVDRVLSFSKLSRELAREKVKNPSSIDVICLVLKKHGIRKLRVPANFPLEYADRLRARGHEVRPMPEPFFEKRALKNAREAGEIEKALCLTEEAVGEALEILMKSEVRGHGLYHHGEVLTSEALRRIIHTGLLRRDLIPTRTIVASGKQTCDPHGEGSGPLEAHAPIIIDVFPYSASTHYFADITRTVVRGKASPKLKRMFTAVKEAQEIAFRKIRHGIDGSKIHKAILRHFQKRGFRTGFMKGRMQGFFHSTGHGLGLEVHEPPRISLRSEGLRKGHVVTVEPGLYYADAGGVRLEDVVLVTKQGNRNLTRLSKQLEL